MARRDQLTYDLGRSRRSPVPWKPTLLLAAVVTVAGLLLVWTVMSSRGTEAAGAGGPVTASPIDSVAPGASTDPSASASSPVPAGSDAGDGMSVPEGSQQAASAFVLAWLDPNTKTRHSALEQVAAPGLVEQLMLTNPENVPRARPAGAPVLADASTYSTQFTQALTGGSMIEVYLVADPASRYGWVATSVNQA